MSKSIVLYHVPAELMASSTNATPEEMAKDMEPWLEWSAKCGDKLVDIGTPLAFG